MLIIIYAHFKRSAIRLLLEKLSEKAETAVLVVEGKQDKIALKPLIEADFFLLQDNKKSLYESAEKIAAKYKKAVLLLDGDPKGRKLAKEMKVYLHQNGVSVDSKIGVKLLKTAKCRTVQGLKQVVKEIVEEKV